MYKLNTCELFDRNVFCSFMQIDNANPHGGCTFLAVLRTRKLYD